MCENLTSVDIIREGTTNNLLTEMYPNLSGKNGCEEEKLGLKWIIGDKVKSVRFS